jgi:hypothetical protein
VRWGLAVGSCIVWIWACDDEAPTRGKIEPLPESLRPPPAAAPRDAGSTAVAVPLPPPEPIAVKNETPDADVAAAPAGEEEEVPAPKAPPRPKRAAPTKGPFEIELTAHNGYSRFTRTTLIRGDDSGASVQLGTAKGKLSAAGVEGLFDRLDALEWPSLESASIPVTDATAFSLRIRRAHVEQKASLYGGCECASSRRPTEARPCSCAIDEAISLIDDTAADAIVAAMRASTVSVQPKIEKVSAREGVSDTIKCKARLCERKGGAEERPYCFATDRPGIVICRAQPEDRGTLAKLDGDLDGAGFIWAFELPDGVSCVARRRNMGLCSDGDTFNQLVPVAGGWATFRQGLPVPLTKAWWTGPPGKDGGAP